MASNTVKIETPLAHGSGGFVSGDLVVTAAHVIHPDNDVPWPAKKLTVVLFDGTELKVIACQTHPRWAGSFDATADIAVVRVELDQPDIVVPFASDLPAGSPRKVTITGYREGANTGTVTRVAGDQGRDAFVSDNLAYHDGVSGTPVLLQRGGPAVGIATRSPTTPSPGAFIGVPFLANPDENNLQWLIDHCPGGQ